MTRQNAFRQTTTTYFLSRPLAKTLALLLAALGLALPAAAQTPVVEAKSAAETTVLQINEDGGLLGLGAFDTGVIPAEGAGTRLMWYPAKAAFRAGRVGSNAISGGSEWDAANVGEYSVAFGEDTEASGVASTALGFRATASGNVATAVGSDTEASGQASTAMGNLTTASGTYATAMGNRTTASALNATAMGAQTTASGAQSTAMGGITEASGVTSTAMGALTTASGDFATTMGRNTTAQAYGSLAVGFVEGAGTTSTPQRYRFRVSDPGIGAHRFRLQQVDLDGAFAYSEEVAVRVTLAEPFRISAIYPNPFAGHAAVDVIARTSQPVRAALYDLLGRRVAVVHDGVVAANRTVRLAVDGQSLASGVYLLRIVGDDFAVTRRVTLVR